MKLKGAVVVITGGSAGVGRATAMAFAKAGATVALLARDPDGLASAIAEIEQAGGKALGIPTDVADPAQIDEAASMVERELGPIAIWVNNAMVTVFGPFADISPEEYRRATEVTYLGTVWGTMAALRFMRPRNRGCIIQVGSALAYRAIPLQAPYCGAKFAIRGFTDALRCELLHDRSKIHLCMVQMPALNTPQFEWARNTLHSQPQPVPPIFQPEVAARAIVQAAHRRRRELVVGFSSWRAIWANKWVPELIDRYLARAGYRDQQSAWPPSTRAGNLFQPLTQPHRTHGRFDERAHAHSFQLWWSLHAGRTLLVLLLLVCWWYLH